MLNTLMESMKKNSWVWVIIMMAFCVRAVGILHDLPFTYYGDEEHFINRAVSFGSGDFNPHWFHKPALYMYLLFFEYGLYFLFGNLIGWFPSTQEFAIHYFSDKEPFLLIGRLTTTLFSLGIVYLTFRMGEMYERRTVGIIGAVFLALCMGNFSSSIVVKADVPATFFAMASLFFVFRIYSQRQKSDYLWAGFLAGLGMATKYYPVIMVLPMVVAHYLSNRKQGASLTRVFMDFKVWFGILALGVGFFIGSPYNLLDSTWLKYRVSYLLSLFQFGAVERGGGFVSNNSNSLVEKIETFFISIKNMGLVLLGDGGMGFLIGGLALAGLLYFLINRTHSRLLFLSYVGGFILIASAYIPSYANFRHLSMVYPILCLTAAVAVERSVSLLCSNEKLAKHKPWFLALTCLILIVPSAVLIAKYDYRVAHKDTRLLAKEWVEKNIPAGTKLLLEDRGPKLQMSRDNLQKFYHMARTEAGVGPFTTHLEQYYQYRMHAVTGTSYDITEISHPWWWKKEKGSGLSRLESEKDRDYGNPMKVRGVMSLQYYRENGYEYVITDSSTYTFYLYDEEKKGFPSIKKFYQELFETGKLVQEFTPHPWLRRGPTVKIFQISQDQ